MKENVHLKEIFGYFNNHPAGSAPANARQLAGLLGQKLVKPDAVNMLDVRKRAGDVPQHSLETFIGPVSVNLDEYVRYCTDCGEIVLKSKPLVNISKEVEDCYVEKDGFLGKVLK